MTPEDLSISCQISTKSQQNLTSSPPILSKSRQIGTHKIFRNLAGSKLRKRLKTKNTGVGPKGKRKHAYSGRYGETAEIMRKQLRTNISVNVATPASASSVLIDGTGDIGDTVIVHHDRHIDYEDYLLRYDVMEWLGEFVDVLIEVVDISDDFEF